MKGTIIIFLLFVLIIAAAFVADGINRSNIQSQIAPTPTDDYGGLDASIITELNALEAQTSEIRELPTANAIHRQFITTIEELTDLYSENEIQQQSQFYQSFDLIDEATDIQQTLSEQSISLLGSYNFRSQRLTVYVDPNATTLSAPDIHVYVHEYAHALQGQRFDFYVLANNAQGTNDGYLAARSVFEGDATFTARLVMEAIGLTRDDVEVTHGEDSYRPDFPGIFQTEVEFPYVNGAEFIASLYEQGGWELVNQAYENPPQSTEHIYHPDRYLAGDEPQLVIIRSTADVWDDPVWRDSIGGGVLGEFYLRQYLSVYLDEDTVDRAATGWGGDNYVTLYNANTDQTAWLLRLGLDTPEDFTEFVDAYSELTDIRLETESEDITATERCWETDAEALCIFTDSGTLQYGNDNHLLVISAPTLEQARALILTQQRDDLEEDN